MYERRFISANLNRASQTVAGPSVAGYACTWNQLSSDLGGFKEKILPGAFRSCLRENQDIKCLRDHNPTNLLGRVQNKTLSVSEDTRGLHFSCLLPDTECGRSTYT